MIAEKIVELPVNGDRGDARISCPPARRATPGDPPRGPRRGSAAPGDAGVSFHPEPMLWATAETARALDRARAAVFMVGSYDGSRNYGDLMQLQSAVDLVAEFSGVLTLPVIELEFAASDRRAALRPRTVRAGSRPLLRELSRRERARPDTGDELIPAVASPQLAAAVTLPLRGGLPERGMGERKLAMARAVDAVVRPAVARRPELLASGLQLDADWLAGLGVDDRYDLARVSPLGVRDPESRSAAPALAAPPGC